MRRPGRARTWAVRASLALGTLALGPGRLAAERAAEQGAGGGGGLFSISFGLVLWTWVVFLILLGILSRTAWKPLLRALEQREKRIQEELDDARRQREEAARFVEEQKRLLAEAHARAQEVVAEGRKAAEKLKAELLEDGRRQQDAILARAREEIDRERERALEALRREAVDLSLAATEKLLRRQVDSGENRRLVEEFLKEIASERGAEGRS